MRNRKHEPYFIFILAMIVILIPAVVNAQERTDAKLAQTGMKFLTVGVSARQAALADAFTAADGNEVSMFYNPAGMARLDGFADASVGRVSWIADIKYQYAAIAFSPWSGDLGVFGLSFQYADYGEIQETILATNKQGYLDIGTFKPNALALGLGYARALTDKFSVGGNIKYVRQDLGTGISDVLYATDITSSPTGILDSGKVESKNALDVIAFDFGILYRTGFKSLTLGMAVRNFSREVKYQKESFQLPLTFKIGVSMNMFDLTSFDREKQALLLTVDAEHPRDFPEQVKVGLEYVFMNILSARVGYVGPADEHSFSYGLGIKYAMGTTQLGVDYAYTPFGIFNNVQRFSVRFGF